MMKVALNRYSLLFHIVESDSPPISSATIETHPFGLPPFELRSIWVFELRGMDHLLEIISAKGVPVEVCYSTYWSGDTLADPGERLFGISLVDDPKFNIDPRDRPIKLSPNS